MATKKLLAPFDPEKPEKKSKDFLVPDLSEAKPTFATITGANFSRHGLVVFVGREVTVNDVFAKLVDAGRKFESVDDSLALLQDFLEKVASCKVGDVMEIAADPASRFGYALRKTSIKPHGPARKLP